MSKYIESTNDIDFSECCLQALEVSIREEAYPIIERNFEKLVYYWIMCMYIKEYSGKLSAFCGCAIAAGTGMACGLALLRGGDLAVMERVIRNLAASITGMSATAATRAAR